MRRSRSPTASASRCRSPATCPTPGASCAPTGSIVSSATSAPLGVYGKDIKERGQEIFDIATGLIRGLVKETRAEIILPLGGALIPYVVDPEPTCSKATGVQVLNTKAIGIRFAEMCVACGMTQSAITYPRAKLSYEDFVK